jgi:uncharacterized protein YhaN
MEENKNVTPSEPKTFTQEELNGIVEERIKRERAKYEGYDDLKAKAEEYDKMVEANKTELQKATERADQLQSQLDKMLKADEIRKVREKVAAETGVPAGLLSGEDEESCKAQADGILSFATTAKPSAYPVIKDGGEVKHANAPATSEDQFKEWFEQTFH